MDPITDLFNTMHVASVVQARLEATAPWGLIREAEEEAGAHSSAPKNSPSQFAHFGMVSRGNCWLSVKGMPDPLPLTGGDCFLLAPARDRKYRGEGKPETFTFLGFTHFCGQLNSRRAFIVWRITAKKRMVAKLKAIKAELQRRKHHRTTEVGAWLRKVVLGYYQYHAVPGNSTQLRIFNRRVGRLWRSVLVRRSQRAQMRWDRLTPLLSRWIPQPRILHPYPDARFAATHPR